MTVAMGILVALCVGGLARFLLAGRPDQPEFVQRMPDGSVPDLEATPQRVPAAAAPAREEPAHSTSGTDASDLVRAGSSVALKDGDVTRAEDSGDDDAAADEDEPNADTAPDEAAADGEPAADAAADDGPAADAATDDDTAADDEADGATDDEADDDATSRDA